MSHLPGPIMRRAILAGGAGALSLAALPANAGVEAVAAVAEAPDEAWPAEVTAPHLDVCLKMRMATDPGLRIGCLLGRYYGVADGAQTHLFDFLSGAFYLTRRRNDGGFDLRYFEVAYFTDPGTGLPMDSWVNPYTGATVRVPQTKNGPAGTKIGADLRIVPKFASPGMLFEDRYLPAVVTGGNIWLTERVSARIPVPGGGMPVTYNEMTVALARLPDVNDPARTRVPATTSTTINVNWRPWMKMGNRPGNMLGIGAGALADRVDDLPALYQALGRQYYPAIFDDPETFMKKGWT